MTWFDKIGGRKMALVILVIILVALKDVLGIDDETINKLVWLALGGSGAIALEDSVKSFAKKDNQAG